MVRAIASVLAALSVGLTAQADQNVTPISLPSIAETEQAKPDWYQQFTFSSDPTETPLNTPLQSKFLRLE